ncbi:MAG: hypothetical protein QXO57_02600 [Candidatus Aenigmatarchaeota archaeon]
MRKINPALVFEDVVCKNCGAINHVRVHKNYRNFIDTDCFNCGKEISNYKVIK